MNKVALITGANRGLGKAIAIGLAAMQYQTVLMGRKPAELEEVANQIQNESSPKAQIVVCDITNTGDVKKAIADLVSKYGQIDVLVNNAGIYFNGSVDIPEDEFVKMLETNLTAQYSILQEIVPQMKRQKSGYIFNVASRAGKIGFAGSGAYSASKFGLVGLSEALYRELNHLGIRVTALCPGWVNTKMAFEAGTTLNEDQMIQPDDLFKTIEWLLSLSPGACVKEVVLETPYNIS